MRCLREADFGDHAETGTTRLRLLDGLGRDTGQLGELAGPLELALPDGIPHLRSGRGRKGAASVVSCVGAVCCPGSHLEAGDDTLEPGQWPTGDRRKTFLLTVPFAEISPNAQ